MTKSKYGGNKDGLGIYEMMTAPAEVIEKVAEALSHNQTEITCELLDINFPEGGANVRV
ncbi:MAG: hypothetical protein PHQ00_05465 [Phycisphaerae bacterium]|nr:hypothetical protein [Phycisphaerae bacterium]